MNEIVKNRRLWTLLLILVAIQLAFTYQIRGLRAAIEEMPPPPTDRALKVMSFGDEEFLFRYLGRWLEFVGDGGGRVRGLRFYDYDRVVGWLEALDRLDKGRSDYTQHLATHYFGEITPAVDPDHLRLRKIVDYVRITALTDPPRYWQWLVWVGIKARNPMHDRALVMQVARDLLSPELKDARVPAWVRVLPVRLYRFAGDEAAARDVIAHISPEDMATVEADRRRLQEKIRELMTPKGATAPQADDEK